MPVLALLLAAPLLVACTAGAQQDPAAPAATGVAPVSPAGPDGLVPVPGGVTRLAAGLCGDPQRVDVETGDGQHFSIAARGSRLVLYPLPLCNPPSPPVDTPDGLPDGEVSTGDGALRAAWLAEPTDRYDHGVLGDAVEAGALRVETASGRRLTHRLDDGSVFEDRMARIVDVGHDGREEVLVVHTRPDSGAALALFAVEDDELRPAAESEPLGRSHRWLNPVGVGDFDGDGRDEVAAVVTPHIGGVLTLYERDGTRLVTGQRVGGVSNHAAGSRELGLSAVVDANGDDVPDIAVPGSDRRLLNVLTFAGGQYTVLRRYAHGAEIGTAIVVADVDGDGRPELVYGLRSGFVFMRRF